MTPKPDKAFILAAGMGSRLRPYTDTMPKPMVPVAGKSIIHRALEKLEKEGVTEVVVNIHYLAPVLQKHLELLQQPRIIISHENDLLDTGGGVKKMLHVFDQNPFYMINGDALWEEEPSNTALFRLAAAWDESRMDMILLLQRTDGMTLTGGVGDYVLTPDGRAVRRTDKSGTHMFAGIRIVHPRLFEGTPDGAFSFLPLMDKAQQKGRLYGIEHQGEWHHISTPAELERVDAAYRTEGRE
jgi:MurNAc alpha-1-phosphate uridylyltransferase